MATPSEKLAESLAALKALQDGGAVAIRSGDLSRTHRERLLANGFLQEVMKGWYVPVRPDEAAGESTAWYASFWDFCASYLNSRFGDDWCLSPEQSLRLHVGNHAVPPQLLVRSPRGGNKPTLLPFNTSLFDLRLELPANTELEEKDGLRLFTLPASLIGVAPGFFRQCATDTRAALGMVRDASEILPLLLDGGHSTIAGRLAGAFRNIGRERIADAIVKTMKSAGYDVRETDPFESAAPTMLAAREVSPHVNRIRLMWHQHRAQIIGRFPPPPGLPKNTKAYLKQVEDKYVTDAYNSLSIEGYRVSHDLIERVRIGNWDPDANAADRNHRDALAARGYWQAFQAVRQSVERILTGANPGVVADEDHGTWYREMFAPSVAAGLMRPADLAGYRNGQVYIRRSQHVPPRRDAVADMMSAFFDLLANETDAGVRVVLGHFAFVYIHPYMDGNGRMGRFLMNTMMAAGGYPWTVIAVESRDAYMAALEQASVHDDIVPFSELLAAVVDQGMKEKPGTSNSPS
jgi:hypothetical protein